MCIYDEDGSMTCIQKLVFLSFSSPLADWYMQKWHLLKLGLCCGLLLSNVHLSTSCNCFEDIGGTLFIKMLEIDDLIDGKHHQERSLENN